MIKLIVAYDDNRVIGNGDKIPWRIPEDMAHFKESTDGCPVIMGRKTFDSIPKKFRPLPGRFNIVVTRNPEWQADPAPHVTTNCVYAAVELALGYNGGGKDPKDIWIIGGAQIYKAALEEDVVQEIIASEVFGTHEGDVFFPELPAPRWEPTVLKEHDKFRIVSYRKQYA